ncbi:MAG: riboflavin kinase [Planctomycetota bacterium]|nr:riboflavin kinase [Planctomycetota bacterium]
MATAISIGNFDAVHLGHIALIKAARKAVGSDGRVEMWSFDPPPVSLIQPERHIDRLTTLQDRISLLLDAGADEVKRIVPTQALLSKSPQEYIEEICEQKEWDFIVEGEGFRFGKDRAGNCDTLVELGEDFEFVPIIVEGIEVALKDQAIVRASSSMVRWLLHAGRVEDASIMLGRDFSVHGVVVSGDHQGRDLGYPTANIHSIDTMLPRDGVYAGQATIDTNSTYPAAISIGTKPTFGDNDRVCEVHIIGYDGPMNYYNWPLTVTISHWIRDQLRFDTKEDLIYAIDQDISHVAQLLES